MIKPFLISLLMVGVACGEESILASTAVPGRLLPQGKVCLVRREENVVVQSLIKTRFPDKVCRAIVEKEERNWPGHVDMKRYVSTLEMAFSEYRKRKKGAVLSIDFISGPEGTRVDLSFPPDPVWRSLPLSAAYVQKNQEYILADAFGEKSDALIQKLRALNPMEESDGS